MKQFVLDASTALNWCFPDEDAADAQHALNLLQHDSDYQAVSVCFWPAEVLNGLLMAERRKRITRELSAAFLRDLEKLRVQLDAGIAVNPFVPAVEVLARRHGLTAYDATYLECAIRLAVPLATLDKDLLKAARAAGVPVVTPSLNWPEPPAGEV